MQHRLSELAARFGLDYEGPSDLTVGGLCGLSDDLPGTLSFIAVVFAFALVIGSFLNVVIHRLPIMMEREWREQCEELCSTPPEQELPTGRFDLIAPRSRCPHCGHMIKAWQNIPVISYLLLGGQCSKCKESISARYPFVEMLTAVLAAGCAWRFGVGWEALMAIVLTLGLIPIALIDADTQLIPDAIVLPLMWIGLGMSLSPSSSRRASF